MLVKIEEMNEEKVIINTDHITAIKYWSENYRVIYLLSDRKVVVKKETADRLVKFIGYRDLEKIGQNGE